MRDEMLDIVLEILNDRCIRVELHHSRVDE